MIDFTIKAETEEVYKLLVMFLKNYKDPVCEFINTVAPHEGQSADSFIEFGDNNEITLYQYARDKGSVLGTFTPDQLTLGDYKDLPTGGLYGVVAQDGLKLMLKTVEGEPDKHVGRFKTINDAVKGIATPELKAQVQKLLTGPLDSEAVKARVKKASKKEAKQ